MRHFKPLFYLISILDLLHIVNNIHFVNNGISFKEVIFQERNGFFQFLEGFLNHFPNRNSSNVAILQ